MLVDISSLHFPSKSFNPFAPNAILSIVSSVGIPNSLIVYLYFNVVVPPEPLTLFMIWYPSSLILKLSIYLVFSSVRCINLTTKFKSLEYATISSFIVSSVSESVFISSKNFEFTDSASSPYISSIFP